VTNSDVFWSRFWDFMDEWTPMVLIVVGMVLFGLVQCAAEVAKSFSHQPPAATAKE
jgi:hypothetical protein